MKRELHLRIKNVFFFHMVLALNGNVAESLSGNNLLGTIVAANPMEKQMMDKLMIPFAQRKWEQLNYNFLLWNARFEKAFDPESEYRYFLQMVELFLNEKKKAKEIQPGDKEKEPTELGEMMYVLPPIRLKPEYEIHKLLYGTPFDPVKIARIAHLMKREGITVDKIRNILG
jgi:hypothetical protein